MYFPSEALNDAFVMAEMRICSIRGVLKDLSPGINRERNCSLKVNKVDCQEKELCMSL